MNSTKRFFAPLETNPAETRATVSPDTVSKLSKLGLEVLIQSGAGTQSDYSDADYENAGAKIVANADTGYAQADIVARVSKPSAEDLDKIKPGTLHISFLDPFNEKGANRRPRQARHFRHQHGNDPPQHAGAKNGCTFLASKSSWLCCCNHGDRSYA